MFTARARLADALKTWDWSGIGAPVQVVSSPADVVLPPAVAVVPDDPYLTPASYCSLAVQLRVSVFAARAELPGALDTWEVVALEVVRCVGELAGAVVVDAGRVGTVQVADAELLAGSVSVRMMEVV